MSSSSEVYSSNFYETIANGSLQSAEIVVPLIMDLVQPKSEVDVGCGIGNWLAVFQTKGIIDVLGIDGPWVSKSQLRIPSNNFLSVDISQSAIRIERKFDLVISLEVAEHLPASRAVDFVTSLTELGSIILFSAAIPFQGGKKHVNEQWPEYWVNLFYQHDYVPVDCLRQKIWTHIKVEFWYAQNSLLFVHRNVLAANQKLAQAYQDTKESVLPLVHPKLFLLLAKQRRNDKSNPIKHAIKSFLKFYKKLKAQAPLMMSGLGKKKKSTAFMVEN